MDHPANQETANRRALLAGIGGVAAGAFLGAGRAEASPLIPPGPPAPTMKPLDEVEPRIPVGPDTTPGSGTNVFVINQPGSYYLTGNIHVPSGHSGIAILAAGVHLDLMGFAIRGVAGSLRGIASEGPSGVSSEGVVVTNGTIEGLGESGILISFRHSRLSRLVVTGCAGNEPFSHSSVHVGTDSVVEDCTISGSPNSFGLSMGARALVARCSCIGNHAGVSTGPNSAVQDCVMMNNSGEGVGVGWDCKVDRVVATNNGFTGIRTSLRCVVSRCVANSNVGAFGAQVGNGIQTGNGSEVIACVTANNTGSGILGGSNTLVADCVADSNERLGISLGDGGMVRRCEASGNDQAGIIMGAAGSAAQCNVRGNGGAGIDAKANCQIIENTVASNSSGGILAGIGSTVRDNIVATNTGGAGIGANDNCQILENTVSSGSGAGILAGNGCMVRGNTISDNTGRGITLASSSTIADNNVTLNRGGGISVVSDNTIKGNHVINNRNAQNVGWGIRVEGAGNRVEANHMILNSPGLQLVGGSNLILNNSARANTPNYSIAGGNTAGPIVNSGSIGTSSNPHANYEF